MSRHICCHRNYVLCSVINPLYCVLHCSSVSSDMFVLTCLYCAGLCVCVCIACCLLVTLLLCDPLCTYSSTLFSPALSTVIPQLTEWGSRCQQVPLHRDGGTDCSTPRYAPCSVTIHECTSQCGGCGRVLVFIHGCNAYPTVCVYVSLCVHVRLPLCTCEQ